MDPKSFPLPIRVMRAMVPLLYYLFPKRMGKWYVNRFLTPVRFPMPQREREALTGLEVFDFMVEGKTLVGYRRGKGPEIVFVHGWSGRALQFESFIEPVVKAGYTFVAFDAWGHGKTSGKRSNVFEFEAGLKALLSQCKDPKAVVGHSLGAAVTSMAISNGVRISKFVSLGAPARGEQILEEYASIVNAPLAMNKYIKAASLQEYGKPFNDFAMETTLSATRGTELFAAHDKDDKDAGFSHFSAVTAARPDAKTLVTSGLGHRRILRDEKVIQAVLEFIEDSTSKE